MEHWRGVTITYSHTDETWSPARRRRRPQD
ncbi:hypothetical protein HID58_035938 [Brassica napus]|uniref:Uncharacterized protein n=1 Tax=Brassica napus TaxID=3708 RepID=A0ABQ8C6A7_BRANA|nr:hypothetical protein HID58_035938 [Brassica napus]